MLHNLIVMNQPPFKKISIILSKATVENVYAAMVLAHGARSEGIDANLFFTFFGLEVVTKRRMEHLHVAAVGNPAMHMPSLLGILPGVEALATAMMQKQMAEIDVPSVPEFLDMIREEGVRFYACKMTVDMFKLKKEDLSDAVEDIVSVGEFYELAGGEGSQIVFI